MASANKFDSLLDKHKSSSMSYPHSEQATKPRGLWKSIVRTMRYKLKVTTKKVLASMGAINWIHQELFDQIRSLHQSNSSIPILLHPLAQNSIIKADLRKQFTGPIQQFTTPTLEPLIKETPNISALDLQHPIPINCPH